MEYWTSRNRNEKETTIGGSDQSKQPGVKKYIQKNKITYLNDLRRF